MKFRDAAHRAQWIDDMKARKAAKASGTTKSVKAPGKPAKKMVEKKGRIVPPAKAEAKKRKVGKSPANALPFKGKTPPQSKPVAAKSEAPATPVAKKLTPPPAMVAAPIHTMERSYLRSGAPGAGMLRGKNYQATVTFTEEQFLKLRDKASFNNRSLAEQIRWSVIQQQAK